MAFVQLVCLRPSLGGVLYKFRGSIWHTYIGRTLHYNTLGKIQDICHRATASAYAHAHIHAPSHARTHTQADIHARRQTSTHALTHAVSMHLRVHARRQTSVHSAEVHHPVILLIIFIFLGL